MLAQGGAVFKGIPYAAPPVGDLRWREPMPVNGGLAFVMRRPFRLGTETIKEDCLYLNIWTADIGESGPIVLVGEPASLSEAEKRGEGLASRWKAPTNASVDQPRAVAASGPKKRSSYWGQE
jgi:hypothetical protein